MREGGSQEWGVDLMEKRVEKDWWRPKDVSGVHQVEGWQGRWSKMMGKSIVGRWYPQGPVSSDFCNSSEEKCKDLWLFRGSRLGEEGLVGFCFEKFE